MNSPYWIETRRSKKPMIIYSASDEEAIAFAEGEDAIILYEEISATEMRTVWEATPLPPIDFGPGYRAAETANGE